jgi:Fic family protein
LPIVATIKHCTNNKQHLKKHKLAISDKYETRHKNSNRYMELQILHSELLDQFLRETPTGLQENFDALQDAELSTPSFSFYTSVASVFSSKIEGETIELDSYIKHKRDRIAFQPDYTKKIDDLYTAYLFAQTNPLNEENLKTAHKQLSKHIVATAWQGKYRTQNMYVATDDGRIEYVAAQPQAVTKEMEKFFSDIDILLNKPLSIEEVFYYASMVHLVFVKVHPWNDGNGRSARLLEKWFLAQKLGPKAWFVQSEKMYYKHHQSYYNNLRLLGIEYPELDYSKAIPFLLMLPSCLDDSIK